MNNETKQDVFKDVVETLHVMDGAPDDSCKDLIDQYDDALPDNLPVIPKVVGEYIKRQKDGLLTEPLFTIFLTIQHNINTDNPPDLEAENWIINHGNTFASAWVLGVWRVKETGEIVKLEEGHG